MTQQHKSCLEHKKRHCVTIVVHEDGAHCDQGKLYILQSDVESILAMEGHHSCYGRPPLLLWEATTPAMGGHHSCSAPSPGKHSYMFVCVCVCACVFVRVSASELYALNLGNLYI